MSGCLICSKPGQSVPVGELQRARDVHPKLMELLEDATGELVLCPTHMPKVCTCGECFMCRAAEQEAQVAQDVLSLVLEKVSVTDASYDVILQPFDGCARDAVPSLAELQRWSAKEVEACIAWAGAVHLRASDNPGVTIPAAPEVLIRWAKEHGVYMPMEGGQPGSYVAKLGGQVLGTYPIDEASFEITHALLGRVDDDTQDDQRALVDQIVEAVLACAEARTEFLLALGDPADLDSGQIEEQARRVFQQAWMTLGARDFTQPPPEIETKAGAYLEALASLRALQDEQVAIWRYLLRGYQVVGWGIEEEFHEEYDLESGEFLSVPVEIE
jgi:hypothetical protein